ncbi:MAG: hypothetical protein ABJ327_26410 [Litoreibacter sp.]
MTLALGLYSTASFAASTFSIAPCQMPAAQIEIITNALAQEGWSVQDLSALGPTTIDHLAWMRAADYLTGDSAGEKIEDIVELQRKTVLGLARKLDLNTSHTRVMTLSKDNDQKTVLINWQKPLVGPLEVRCTFSSFDMTVPSSAENAPVARRDPNENGVTMTHLNSSILNAPFNLITETYFSFTTEDL